VIPTPFAALNVRVSLFVSATTFVPFAATVTKPCCVTELALSKAACARTLAALALVKAASVLMLTVFAKAYPESILILAVLAKLNA